MKDLEFANCLKLARLQAKISVRHISEILTEKGFRASTNTIYSWENGNSQPTPDAFLILCAVYGISDILLTFGYSTTEKKPTTENGSELDDSEQTLVDTYRDMTPKGQKVLLDTAETLHENFKKDDCTLIKKEVG